jgi:hypothetical protein
MAPSGAPSIQSREEFRRQLLEALALVERRLKRSPHAAPLHVVQRQLRAMQRWTEGMRTPTGEEREKIAIGLIAARELDDDEAMAGLCHRLNYFFQEWPPAHGQ